MIRFFKDDKNVFQVRIASLLFHKDHVLFLRRKKDRFWGLPGGRLEWGESSKKTLVREFQEELGWEIRVDRLLWVLENFYHYEGKEVHELNWIYLSQFTEKEETIDITSKPFSGMPGTEHLEFCWFPVENISSVPLHPSFLAEKITDLPAEIEHRVIYEKLDP